MTSPSRSYRCWFRSHVRWTINSKGLSSLSRSCPTANYCHIMQTVRVAISQQNKWLNHVIVLHSCTSNIILFYHYTFIHTSQYEGRPINKLQNSIILLIFKIRKIRSVRFVGNLILNTSCEFHYHDITVTSVINITVESIPQGTAFCCLFSVDKKT